MRTDSTGTSAMAQLNAVLDCIDHLVAAIGQERELATSARRRLVADVERLYHDADALRRKLAEEISEYRRTASERWDDLDLHADEPAHPPYSRQQHGLEVG